MKRVYKMYWNSCKETCKENMRGNNTDLNLRIYVNVISLRKHLFKFSASIHSHQLKKRREKIKTGKEDRKNKLEKQ